MTVWPPAQVEAEPALAVSFDPALGCHTLRLPERPWSNAQGTDYRAQGPCRTDVRCQEETNGAEIQAQMDVSLVRSGATGCWAYFTLKALYQLGRVAEARAILYPMLSNYAAGQFQGFGVRMACLATGATGGVVDTATRVCWWIIATPCSPCSTTSRPRDQQGLSAAFSCFCGLRPSESNYDSKRIPQANRRGGHRRHRGCLDITCGEHYCRRPG